MNTRTEQPHLKLVTVVIVVLVIAILLGIVIGSHDYFMLTTDLHDYWTLIFVVLFVALILYVAFLQHFTWEIALLICYLGILFRPLGFDVGPTEVTCGLGGLLAVMTSWRKLPWMRSSNCMQRDSTRRRVAVCAPGAGGFARQCPE